MSAIQVFMKELTQIQTSKYYYAPEVDMTVNLRCSQERNV